eukprot:GEMP01026433.1.p1 GENE.GEMP01026433.1~~GEMP01026433.1.p1  ORF type:complete len:533 (-),score=87.02 GEMP01026433.1:774-2342(-)
MAEMSAMPFLSATTKVDVFYRSSRDPGGYFMVHNNCAGRMHPSIGITDGWTPAQVTEDFDPAKFDLQKPDTFVRVRYTHQLWFDCRGKKLDAEMPRSFTAKVHPQMLRLAMEDSQAPQPKITFVTFRWGGEKPVEPVTEGPGGWGNIGSTCSNNYINGFFDEAMRLLGPSYEVISIFFQNSQELENNQLVAPIIHELSRGEHIGAMYFCWPIGFADGHDYPAYVERSRLMKLMEQMQAAGIPTRFPHNSHQYRVFASKEWAAQQCLTPGLNVPLTTKLSRQMIEYSGAATAANEALQALRHLKKARSTLFGFDNVKENEDFNVSTGVVKLGWSWEAMDVIKWTNFHQLRKGIQDLVEQPDNMMDFVFVQEFVDFDVEMRHYVVCPAGQEPPPIKKIVYTKFKELSAGRFCDFDRFNREECVHNNFEGDSAALADAEEKAKVLISRWLKWLRADSAELPVVLRFDIMAKRVGPGQARVMTGELTELGGCFLGWPEGPKIVFEAMIQSFFGSHNGRWNKSTGGA